jgi:Rod binding domain-containing protein
MKIQSLHFPSYAQPADKGSPVKFAEKLRQAGQELESILLTDTFSKLRQSFSLKADDSGDAGHDTLTGLADQAACDALAARGGLGLGAMIRGAVEKKP